MTRTTERPTSVAVTTRSLDPDQTRRRTSGCSNASSSSNAISGAVSIEIGLKPAHQAFDGTGALFLGRIQPTAARRREAAARNGANIARNVGNILDVSVLEPGNRRRAEADQGLAGVVRIALEIAVQPPRRGGAGQRVAGPRKMIDADLQVSLAQKFLGDDSGLIDALLDAGQRRFVDAALVGLQARHVGIAVAGDAIRRRASRRSRRSCGARRWSAAAVRRSGRNSDCRMPAARSRVTAASTSRIGCQRPIAACTSGLTSCTPRLARLTPSSFRLAARRWRHVSRIEFDGVFVAVFKDETLAQDSHDGREPFGTEDARRSAAPVQPGDTQRSGQDVR